MLCRQYGHEIVALANLLPPDDEVQELDSYMYQTVGHNLIGAYAECMGLPLFRKRLGGTSKSIGMTYERTEGDEVEDLIRKGRDTERLALARALRLHLRRQVMVYRGRTAVFA